MRFLTISLLSFLMFACGPATPPDAPITDAPIAEDEVTTEQNEEEEADNAMTSRGLETSEPEEQGEAAQLAAIRKDYARIEKALKAGILRKDSITYDCDYAMVGGQIDWYTNNGDLLLAIHECYMGDHAGSTEHYYFRDGKPVFLYRETGSWQFGGEMLILEDGSEEPGTVDKISEDRMYFHNGSTIKALTKAYEMINGKGDDPNSVPNETMAHNGELPASLGMIQSAIATRKVDCKLVEEL
jgi:hypothetical protein